MELAAQPIFLPICMNAYFFCGRFVLHLQTGNVNRSAISSGAFAVFPLEIHWIQSWNTPPMPLEFQTALPPHVFGIPVQETPPLPRNSKMPPVVWYGYFLESPNAINSLNTTANHTASDSQLLFACNPFLATKKVSFLQLIEKDETFKGICLDNWVTHSWNSQNYYLKS